MTISKLWIAETKDWTGTQNDETRFRPAIDSEVFAEARRLIGSVVVDELGDNDPTEAYLRWMAALHPDWRPLDVLRAVLDALLAAQDD